MLTRLHYDVGMSALDCQLNRLVGNETENVVNKTG
jgi:hypothetical protein